MTPHIHHYIDHTDEHGVLHRTCRSCSSRQHIEEFEPFDSVRPPEPPTCNYDDAEFSGEANDVGNIIHGVIHGVIISMSIVLALLGLKWLLTGSFLPI